MLRNEWSKMKRLFPSSVRHSLSRLFFLSVCLAWGLILSIFKAKWVKTGLWGLFRMLLECVTSRLI